MTDTYRIYNFDENLLIVRNMKKYGGSFMRALGECLQVADYSNRLRIYHTWEKDCHRYFNL